MPPSIGVLISGRGSNLQAIIDAVAGGRLDARIAVVISNRPEAAGLERARRAGIETLVLSHKAYPDRIGYDRVLASTLKERGVTLVCLAGFMRLLSADFIRAFPNAVLNIHPSLLPAFPGLETHRRAIEAGCKASGASVHFVTAELDHGPIIAQAVVPVLADDDEAALSARVLAQEHRLYPRAIAWLVEGRLESRDGVVRHRDGVTQLLLPGEAER